MEILKVIGFEKEAISRAVKVLEEGSVIVVPTDTVYGLAADTLNEKAVEKIFEIKKRPREKNLPIFVSSWKMLDGVADVKDERVMAFLQKVWPGKITCVLKARNGETIGIRMPDYNLVLKIVEKLGRSIIGTSANISGGKEHVKISDLLQELKNFKIQPDLILDAGDLPPSKPSTVLDCTLWPPKILREGAVSGEELKKTIGGSNL